MTTADLAFWQRLNSRASRLTPGMALAYLAAFALLQDALSDPSVADMIARGDVEGVIRFALSDAAFTLAFAKVRSSIRTATADAVRYFATDIPGSRIGGQLTIGFDILNPRVIDALRAMESRQLDSLALDIRNTVRMFLEHGMVSGRTVTTMARDLRHIVGLAPNQIQEALNFRAKLQAGDFSGALQYRLRDKRFDSTLRRLETEGTKLTPAQIESMSDAYLRKKRTFNATTNARTAATNALKLGQRLSWQDAIDKHYLDVDLLTKTWRGIMDRRERPEHVAMEGETVGFDDLFKNRQLIPGESDYNCRCVAIYRLKSSPLS